MSFETTPTFASEASCNSFIKYLNSSKRILVLCGAGLSAASGIPTFRGSGAYWRGHKAASLSSIEAFEANPGLVWSYFADRRRLALEASPNKGHVALAKMAERKKGFFMLTQNIDGLSEKALHPQDRLYSLHGSLMDIKCSNPECDYVDKGNTREPICPALTGDAGLVAFTAEENTLEQLSSLKLSGGQSNNKYVREANPLEAILESLAPTITPEMRRVIVSSEDLPHCPECSSLLRPGVVWFGEALNHTMFKEINAWIDMEKRLDLMMVIGTQAEVYPAARFVQTAKDKGARIAVVNLDGNHMGDHVLRKQDWLFEGDAAEVLDVLFEGILEN